jgi:hypothetical protein
MSIQTRLLSSKLAWRGVEFTRGAIRSAGTGTRR